MINIEYLKSQILERLSSLNLSQIILFGSYAYGTPNEDSDIDLYVVTNDEFIPQTWKEKNDLYLKVSRNLRDLRKFVAIDLIVHSKPMNRILQENNSSFYRNDIKNGIVLQ